MSGSLYPFQSLRAAVASDWKKRDHSAGKLYLRNFNWHSHSGRRAVLPHRLRASASLATCPNAHTRKSDVGRAFDARHQGKRSCILGYRLKQLYECRISSLSSLAAQLPASGAARMHRHLVGRAASSARLCGVLRAAFATRAALITCPAASMAWH